MGFRNHKHFLIFILSLIAGITLFDYLSVACESRALTLGLMIDILENAPEVEPSLDGPSLCSVSETLCRAASFDSFLLAAACWGTLQLTWTSLLAVSHLWQISRQMTTFEVSNLGRYGYMGGRGGSSLREQSGAVKQAAHVGAGIGPSGAGEEGAGGEAGAAGMVVGPDGQSIGHAHSHRHHHHSHGIAGVCGRVARAVSGPLMQVLGLDRFTKGKAVSGMRRAGRDQNPFDLGVIRVSP